MGRRREINLTGTETCRHCGRPITQEPILRAWYHSGRPSARSFWCNPSVRFEQLTGETLAEPVSRARPWRVSPSRHTGTPRACGDPRPTVLLGLDEDGQVDR